MNQSLSETLISEEVVLVNMLARDWHINKNDAAFAFAEELEQDYLGLRENSPNLKISEIYASLVSSRQID